MDAMDKIIAILKKDPGISWYISQIELPRISAFRKELRERARELDEEIAALLKRREELEIIRRWHAIASFEGLAVSEGTGKKHLQEARDGINILRNRTANAL
jgi:hypothetical protein